MAKQCFDNPKFGVFVALVNILVLVLFSVYKIFELMANVDNDKVTNSLYYKGTTLLLVCLVMFALCVVLIVGVLKENHYLMAPWLGVNFVCIVGNFFYTLVTLGQCFINELKWSENFLRIYPAAMTFFTQICIFYPIYVVYESILVKRHQQNEVSSESNPDDALIDAEEVY